MGIGSFLDALYKDELPKNQKGQYISEIKTPLCTPVEQDESGFGERCGYLLWGSFPWEKLPASQMQNIEITRQENGTLLRFYISEETLPENIHFSSASYQYYEYLLPDDGTIQSFTYKNVYHSGNGSGGEEICWELISPAEKAWQEIPAPDVA